MFTTLNVIKTTVITEITDSHDTVWFWVLLCAMECHDNIRKRSQLGKKVQIFTFSSGNRYSIQLLGQRKKTAHSSYLSQQQHYAACHHLKYHVRKESGWPLVDLWPSPVKQTKVSLWENLLLYELKCLRCLIQSNQLLSLTAFWE